MAILSRIDRFGVKAIMGREVLSYGELKRMQLAEDVVRAYTSRKASEKEGGGGWSKWSEDNKYLSSLLNEAMVEAKGLEDGVNG